MLTKYKDVLAWSYEDLKTFDTSIIQHTIPMISNDKTVQQNLRKIHSNLENQIQTKLNKLLKAKSIFLLGNQDGFATWYLLGRKMVISEFV